jgi:hypothetical protein
MIVLVSDFHEIYKCNGQIHKYGIPGVSSKECKSPFAGTLFPPTCSLL